MSQIAQPTPYRTHPIAELLELMPLVARSAASSDQSRGISGHIDVRIAGWVEKKRAFGALVFLEVRDQSAVVQCVVDRGSPAFAAAEALREESVVSVSGRLCERSLDTRNPRSRLGHLEIQARAVDILSRAEVLPFALSDAASVPEELRLRYRFLDLRRQHMRQLVELRCHVVAHLRSAMTHLGFLEIQTPILTASSPEGARDFLVPSRLHPGKCYALPQAPQLFKQLLMASGFERYFQIAPCFRDEDARADRSPGEFYQFDIEMAFVTQSQIFDTIEPVLLDVFGRFGRFALASGPVPRLTFAEAIAGYGSDKPDLRNPLRFVDVGRWAERHLVAPDSQVSFALCVPSGAARSRRFYERILSELPRSVTSGLLLLSDPPRGSLARLPQAAREELRLLLGAERGAAVLVLGLPRPDSGEVPRLWREVAPGLRDRLARAADLIDAERYCLCWITDYPMFEPTSAGGFQFSHNPFSMPQGGMAALSGDPLAVLAYQYDLVCNGVELSSGAIRNHEPDTLLEAFRVAGYSAEEVESRFAGLLRAFRLGAPPHGGLAPGIERLLMLLAGVQNLREVTPFPMTQRGEDLLLGAPSVVDDGQLASLYLEARTPRPTNG